MQNTVILLYFSNMYFLFKFVKTNFFFRSRNLPHEPELGQDWTSFHSLLLHIRSKCEQLTPTYKY